MGYFILLIVFTAAFLIFSFASGQLKYRRNHLSRGGVFHYSNLRDDMLKVMVVLVIMAGLIFLVGA